MQSSFPSGRSRIVSVATAFLVTFFCGQLAGFAQTIRVRSDVWMPFNGSPTAPQPGFAIEVLHAIFDPKGIAIDYQVQPWKTALEELKAGTADAAIGATPKEAPSLIFPRETIGEARVALFTLASSKVAYERPQDLNHVRLGVIADYTYWDDLDGYVASHPAPAVVKFAGDTPLVDAIAKLRAGEIDAIPETTQVFIWTVRESGLSPSDFRIAYRHPGEPVYVAFTPVGENGKRWAMIYETELKALRLNGTLAKILARYGMSDWKE